jgi:hypothetical protein
MQVSSSSKLISLFKICCLTSLLVGEDVTDPSIIISAEDGSPPTFIGEDGTNPSIIISAEYGSAPPIFVGADGSTPPMVSREYGFTTPSTVSLQIHLDQNFFRMLQNFWQCYGFILSVHSCGS